MATKSIQGKKSHFYAQEQISEIMVLTCHQKYQTPKNKSCKSFARLLPRKL